jgi:biotin transport system substrate-specific component
MKLTVKEMTMVSMFAAFACAGGLLLRFGGEAVVPFSVLPLVVLLSGVLLGGRLGALSMIVYLIIGLIGIPVFASAPYGGIGYFLKPTAGFLFGFIAAAYIVGWITELIGKNNVWTYMAASCAGLVVIYLIGLPYLYVVLNFIAGKAVNVAGVLKIGFLPFIGFDFIKALIVSVIAVPVSKQIKHGARQP